MDLLIDWRWMLAPLLACLLLSVSHVYMGVHVVARKVIFVDLALAQIAAVGATYATTRGYDPDNPADVLAIALFSLTFTLVGAGLFAVARMRKEKVPQEAFIGIVYAAASAAAVLILSRSPTGGEELRDMLVGDILLVSPRTIANISVIYALVGIFHVFFRERFFAISIDADRAARAGIPVRTWDFLFYMTLGILVTQSVSIAGVLLVFSYLVIPGVVGQMWSPTLIGRLLIGWTVGILGSVVGIVWSFYADYPTGPTVVLSLASCLVVAGIGYYLVHAESRRRAVRNVAIAAVFTFAFLFALPQFGKEIPEGEIQAASPVDLLLEALANGAVAEQLEAIGRLEAVDDPRVVPAIVTLLESSESEQTVEAAVEALAGRRDEGVRRALRSASERDYDAFLRLKIGEALIDSEDAYGYEILVAILSDDDAGFARALALDRLQSVAGNDFGYRADLAVAENQAALERIKEWAETIDPL